MDWFLFKKRIKKSERNIGYGIFSFRFFQKESILIFIYFFFFKTIMNGHSYEKSQEIVYNLTSSQTSSIYKYAITHTLKTTLPLSHTQTVYMYMFMYICRSWSGVIIMFLVMMSAKSCALVIAPHALIPLPVSQLPLSVSFFDFILIYIAHFMNTRTWWQYAPLLNYVCPPTVDFLNIFIPKSRELRPAIFKWFVFSISDKILEWTL